MISNIQTTEKVIYDPKAVRRIRNFLVQVLIILDERRKISNKPKSYQNSDWEYREIKNTVHWLSDFVSGGLKLNVSDNTHLIDTYDVAVRIYYDRIMNMFKYYRETNDLIKISNGQKANTPTDIGLMFGSPRVKST